MRGALGELPCLKHQCQKKKKKKGCANISGERVLEISDTLMGYVIYTGGEKRISMCQQN